MQKPEAAGIVTERAGRIRARPPARGFMARREPSVLVDVVGAIIARLIKG